MPKTLPVYDLSEDDFRKFREKYLDSGRLSKKAIKEIGTLFGTIGDLCCNECHAHKYECIVWEHPESAIVARLINEIEDYQSLIKEIRNLAE